MDWSVPCPRFQYLSLWGEISPSELKFHILRNYISELKTNFTPRVIGPSANMDPPYDSAGIKDYIPNLVSYQKKDTTCPFSMIKTVALGIF